MAKSQSVVARGEGGGQEGTGKDRSDQEKIPKGDRFVHHLNCGDGFIGMYIC